MFSLCFFSHFFFGTKIARNELNSPYTLHFTIKTCIMCQPSRCQGGMNKISFHGIGFNTFTSFSKKSENDTICNRFRELEQIQLNLPCFLHVYRHFILQCSCLLTYEIERLWILLESKHVSLVKLIFLLVQWSLVFIKWSYPSTFLTTLRVEHLHPWQYIPKFGIISGPFRQFMKL